MPLFAFDTCDCRMGAGVLLMSCLPSPQVLTAGIGCDQTSIYVVMSRTFQRGQLQPWLDLTQSVRLLARAISDIAIFE